jgi:hypothetical protein
MDYTEYLAQVYIIKFPLLTQEKASGCALTPKTLNELNLEGSLSLCWVKGMGNIYFLA